MLILRFHFPRKFFRKSSFIPIFLFFMFSFFISPFSSSSFLPVSYAFLSFSIFHSVITFSFLHYIPYFLILLQFYKLIYFPFPIVFHLSTFCILFFNKFSSHSFLHSWTWIGKRGGGSVFNGFGYFKE